jgi:hypothetical protein
MAKTAIPQPQDLPLTRAAMQLKRPYNTVLRLVLTGVLRGRQSNEGRWYVEEASLEEYLAKHRDAPANAAA